MGLWSQVTFMRICHPLKTSLIQMDGHQHQNNRYNMSPNEADKERRVSDPISATRLFHSQAT